MSFPQTTSNNAPVVETQRPLCKECVRNNNVAQQDRWHLSSIIVEWNSNVQDRTLYHKINSISHNVVPNVPQISSFDVVSITINSYQSIIRLHCATT